MAGFYLVAIALANDVLNSTIFSGTDVYGHFAFPDTLPADDNLF